MCRPTSPPAFHHIATPLNISFGHNGIQNDDDDDDFDDDDDDDDDDDEKATYGKLLVYIHVLWSDAHLNQRHRRPDDNNDDNDDADAEDAHLNHRRPSPNS